MGAAAVKSVSPSRGRGGADRVGPARSTTREKAGPDSRAPRRSSATRGGKAAKQDAVRRRRVMVAGGLVATLTITSALLLAMQPAPLGLESAKTLMSLTTPREVDALFQTSTPLQTKRWKYVYIHHAGAPAPRESADAAGAPADHFVIGNGAAGGADGEIQVGTRWDTQQVAGRTRGLDRVDPDCISICLAGDLDRSPPTPRQMEQLRRLVTSLQNKLAISRDRVWVVDAPNLPAGCGGFFPRDVFRSELLP